MADPIRGPQHFGPVDQHTGSVSFQAFDEDPRTEILNIGPPNPGEVSRQGLFVPSASFLIGGDRQIEDVRQVLHQCTSEIARGISCAGRDHGPESPGGRSRSVTMILLFTWSIS